MACTLGLAAWQTRLARIAVVVSALCAGAPAALAADCAGNANALGTSRVLTVDGSIPRVGRKHFPDTLPLADKEVVLTFDDGPLPGTTDRILAALKAECVQATFFQLGKMAEAAPDLARRVFLEGHTVAYHSYDHPILTHLRPERATIDIRRGMLAVDTAVYGSTAGSPRTPFFRFPGFATSPELLDWAQAHGLVVFGADAWASDWNPMTPQDELRLIMGRLRRSGGGIVLMHDTKHQTALMLPSLLHALKAGGYKIVHIVPARPAAASANAH
jgi:peptidoglycan/xylan/chitin deacetylase (PgdA/CDA1 family)